MGTALQAKRKLSKIELENFKREYNLDKLAKELDKGKVPEMLEFYFGGVNDRFFEVLNICYLTIKRPLLLIF